MKAPLAHNATSNTRPSIAANLGEYFIPADFGVSQSAAIANIHPGVPLAPEGLVYRPALLGQAQIHYQSVKYGLDMTRQVAALVVELEGSIMRWEEHTWRVYPLDMLQSQPLPQTRYAALPGWLADTRRTAALQKGFTDWVYRSATVKLRSNPALKVFADPDTTISEFRERCGQAARAGLQADLDKLNRAYDVKLNALRQKLARRQGDEQEQKEEVDQRKMEEFSAGGELLLSIFSRRKRSLSSSLAKRRLAGQARSDLEQIRKEMDVLEDQIRAKISEREEAARAAQDRWAGLVNDSIEVPLSPQKKDIYLELFGVAWLPYYTVRAGAQLFELPAYSPALK
jgi:hypothetical protein